MTKIYSNENTGKEIVIRDLSGKTKLIFNLLYEDLSIIYGEMYMKVSKNSIKKIKIEEFEEVDCKKIFLNLEKNIKMEYILFSSDAETKYLIDFFKEFDLCHYKRKKS